MIEGDATSKDLHLNPRPPLVSSSASRSKGSPSNNYQRFVHLKARAPNVADEVAIKAAIKGLRIGHSAWNLASEKP